MHGQDHSKLCNNRVFRNKVIAQSGLFENDIGPGVFQFSVQQTCLLQESQRHKPDVTNYGSILSLPSRTLAWQCLLNAGLEHSRSNLVFKINFMFRMLYCSGDLQKDLAGGLNRVILFITRICH